MIQIIALLVLMGASHLQAMEEENQDDVEAQHNSVNAQAGPEKSGEHKKSKTTRKKKKSRKKTNQVEECADPALDDEEEDDDVPGCFGCLKRKPTAPSKKPKATRMTRSKSTNDVRKEIKLDELEPSQKIFYFKQSYDDQGPLYQDASRTRSMARTFARGNPNAGTREASIHEATIDAQQRGDIVQLLHCIHEISLQNQGKIAQLVQQGQDQQKKDSNKQKLYSLGLSAGSLAVMLISFVVTKYIL